MEASSRELACPPRAVGGQDQRATRRTASSTQGPDGTLSRSQPMHGPFHNRRLERLGWLGSLVEPAIRVLVIGFHGL